MDCSHTELLILAKTGVLLLTDVKLQLEQQRTELQYYKKLCLEEQTGREERIRVLNRDVQQRLVSARVELIALLGVLYLLSCPLLVLCT